MKGNSTMSIILILGVVVLLAIIIVPVVNLTLYAPKKPIMKFVRVGSLALIALAVITATAIWTVEVPAAMENKVVNSDTVVLENVAIQSDYDSRDRDYIDVVNVYQESETGQYYIMATHPIKFWDMWEKQYISEDYVKLLQQERIFEQQLFDNN